MSLLIFSTIWSKSYFVAHFHDVTSRHNPILSPSVSIPLDNKNLPNRRSIEWKGNAGSENISRQTSGLKTGDQLPLASNNRAHAGAVPKSGERAKDGGAPSFHLRELDGGASHSRRREVRRGTSGVPALNIDGKWVQLIGRVDLLPSPFYTSVAEAF